MDKITLRLTGTSALLMHSDRLSDPLDPDAKGLAKLTKKRNKTDDDMLEIARLKWRGALYWDDELGAVIPTSNIRACLVDGAKLRKLDTAVRRGTVLVDEKVKLVYKGPQTPDALWDTPRFVDKRSVVVSRSRIMAYRPRFDAWSLTAVILFDERIIDPQQLVDSMRDAGLYIGIGDYRPNRGGPFGRFAVERV